MDPQHYAYPPHHPRDTPQYGMNRSLHSPPVPSQAARLEGMGEMQQGGLPRDGILVSGGYGAPTHYGHAQLPPLHPRGQDQSHQPPAYSQMASRSMPSPPVSGGMGYATSYMSQSAYPSPVAQFSNNPSLQQYSQPQNMGMQHSTMPYQTDYPSVSSGLTDFRSLPATAHGQSLPDAMAPHGYHLSSSSEDYGAQLQGRRGIQPGEEEGLQSPDSNRSSRSTAVPQKDADGKFPCPSCQKTYLHAKHLKRHTLRHTGQRPYSCALCNDTFSRSDILKRHFLKCSLRRGNPTGVSHLSNSASYIRRQARSRTNDAAGAAQSAGSDRSGETP